MNVIFDIFDNMIRIDTTFVSPSFAKRKRKLCVKKIVPLKKVKKKIWTHVKKIGPTNPRKINSDPRTHGPTPVLNPRTHDTHVTHAI